MGKELATGETALAAAMRKAISQKRSRQEQLAARLAALSPLAILQRGYALVFDAAGNLVTDGAQVEAGQEVSARLARGGFTAKVERASS
jgi:exodeoxyribonuclease VII large subunit